MFEDYYILFFIYKCKRVLNVFWLIKAVKEQKIIAVANHWALTVIAVRVAALNKYLMF